MQLETVLTIPAIPTSRLHRLLILLIQVSRSLIPMVVRAGRRAHPTTSPLTRFTGRGTMVIFVDKCIHKHPSRKHYQWSTSPLLRKWSSFVRPTSKRIFNCDPNCPILSMRSLIQKSNKWKLADRIYIWRNETFSIISFYSFLSPGINPARDYIFIHFSERCW